MEKTNLDTLLLLKIVRLAKPFKSYFLMALFLSIASALLAPIIPFLTGECLDALLEGAAMDTITQICLAMLLVLFIQTIVMLFNNFYSSVLGEKVILSLRNRVYKYTIRQKLGFFDVTPLGTLITRNVSDIQTITNFFSQGIITILGDFLQIITILFVMFYINWKLAMVVMLMLPLLMVSSRIFGRKVKKSFEEVRNQVSKLNTIVQEYIAGITIVQLYHVQNIAVKRFDDANIAHYKANEKSVLYYSVFFPIIEIITALTVGLLFIAACYPGGQSFFFSAGELTAFIMLVNLFYRPIRTIADRYNTIQMGMVASKRIFDLIKNENTQEDFSDKAQVKISNCDIEFKNIYFGYMPETEVLKGINFKIEQGKTLAIVGETGAGKSTIINLISKLYPDYAGEILVGNVNIDQFDLNQLRKTVAVVLQDVFIFSGTLRENIDLDGAFTDIEIENAIKSLGLENILLTKGLDYYVGERGSGLSLGEKQLLGFVRVILLEPPVLILDEATSNIDPGTEAIIQKTIPKLTKNRTSIVIAHRLSTVAQADEIVYISKGLITEKGTHQELLSQQGAYFRLHEAGMKGFSSNDVSDSV